MNTTEIIARLPKTVQDRAKLLKETYGRHTANSNYQLCNETRAEIRGWLHGLQDVGLISEVERQRIYSYLTI